MIKKYKKKPVIVEAIKLTGSETSLDEIAKFLGDYFDGGIFHKKSKKVSIYIANSHGITTAYTGDYIVKGGDDDFYPCSQDIFKKNYEIVK